MDLKQLLETDTNSLLAEKHSR
uniref:Uncharacterized protein n=1 Tax=Rhizophora mucronata TaxID=61149 RepID=A0A2P2QLU4_RHIMU